MWHKSPIIIPQHLILGEVHCGDFLMHPSVPLRLKQPSPEAVTGFDGIYHQPQPIEDQAAVMYTQAEWIYRAMTPTSRAGSKPWSLW